MKDFLKFIGGSLFSNPRIIQDGKHHKFYQSLIILVISLILAIIPVLSFSLGIDGSDALTKVNNSSLDVSLNLFSKYLKEDETASFVTNDKGEYVVTGFEEHVINDSLGNHLLTVRVVNESEDINDVVNYYTHGFNKETNNYSETPKSFMLIQKTQMYIYTFGPNAKNELNSDGSIKKSASPTSSYIGYASSYKNTDFGEFYVDEVGGDKECYNSWKKALNEMYKPYKTSTTLYNVSIYSALNLVIVLTMALIIMILTRLKNSQGEKMNYVQALKCVNFASLCPALISLILGFLVTNLASIAFIICIGIRSVFLGFKATQVTKY